VVVRVWRRGVGEQDEGEQPCYGRVVGQELPEHARQVEGSFG